MSPSICVLSIDFRGLIVYCGSFQNEPYKCVEIDVDGVYSNMLLLKKKKYAAMTVLGRGPDGRLELSRKTSGLDMVRRDWYDPQPAMRRAIQSRSSLSLPTNSALRVFRCPLSKEVSSYVLDRLLSGSSREDVVDSVVRKATIRYVVRKFHSVFSRFSRTHSRSWFIFSTPTCGRRARR